VLLSASLSHAEPSKEPIPLPLAQQEGQEHSAEPSDGPEPGSENLKDAEETDEENSESSTKSDYDIPTAGGPTSVESDLMADDLLKRPVFKILRGTLKPFYRFKDRIDGTWGIAFGVDYNFLNQYASFSFTEKQATSGALRFYGT